MSKTQVPSSDILHWHPDVAAEAKQILLAALEDQPTGEIHEISANIVEHLFPDIDDAGKDDAIGNLLPFKLLELVWSESAEDGSSAFMGPNYCAFSVYKISANDFLVVEDRIEQGEYEVCGSSARFDEALEIVQKMAVDRLGDDIEIVFSDGTTLKPNT